MRRIRIDHSTQYSDPQTVTLLPHTVHLRPRDGHDMRSESSRLDLSPDFEIRWQRDVHGNSMTLGELTQPERQLIISSSLVVEHYEEQIPDFVLEEHARQFPFHNEPAEQMDLMTYSLAALPQDCSALRDRMVDICPPGKLVDTTPLLDQLNTRSHDTLEYPVREHPGGQSPAVTLADGNGSCRGFDPTSGQLVSGDHIAVAVHRHPEAISPVASAFLGPSNPQPERRVALSFGQL